MNMRTVLLLLVAVVAAAMTAMYARNWISSERAAILAQVPKEAPEPEATMVLVAKKELLAGSFVSKDNLKWQAWPEEGLVDGYIVKGKGKGKIDDFVGTVVRSAITVGQPITEARVVHPGDRGFLAAVLTPGMRAVSVPVNATTGISGFVFPGDSVDVILTSKFTEKNEHTGDVQTRYFSETLLNDVRVLAIDQKVENVKGEVSIAKTGTLEVSQKQAEKIAIAMEMGSLSLSLHSLAREELEEVRDVSGTESMIDVASGHKQTGPTVLKAQKPDLKAKPLPDPKRHSYTMDTEVYYMGAGHLGGRSKEVTVLRGGQSAQMVSSMAGALSKVGGILGGKK